jgi:hypothetical protein
MVVIDMEQEKTPELLDKVAGANNTAELYDKDTTILLKINSVSSIKNRILSEFASGQKLTAKQLNDKFNFNDSRKVISVLRSEGKVIRDIRQPDKTKLYFLIPDGQLSLFN